MRGSAKDTYTYTDFQQTIMIDAKMGSSGDFYFMSEDPRSEKRFFSKMNSTNHFLELSFRVDAPLETMLVNEQEDIIYGSYDEEGALSSLYTYSFNISGEITGSMMKYR